MKLLQSCCSSRKSPIATSPYASKRSRPSHYQMTSAIGRTAGMRRTRDAVCVCVHNFVPYFSLCFSRMYNCGSICTENTANKVLDSTNRVDKFSIHLPPSCRHRNRKKLKENHGRHSLFSFNVMCCHHHCHTKAAQSGRSLLDVGAPIHPGGQKLADLSLSERSRGAGWLTVVTKQCPLLVYSQLKYCSTQLWG